MIGGHGPLPPPPLGSATASICPSVSVGTSVTLGGSLLNVQHIEIYIAPHHVCGFFGPNFAILNIGVYRETRDAPCVDTENLTSNLR